MSEQRKSPRSRALLGARARYDQRRVTLDCVVRNVSDGGALLTVPESVPLPNDFELEIPQRQSCRKASVRWRQGEKVGVSFEPSPVTEPAMAEPDDLASRLRRAERSNEQLRNRVAQLTEAG